jgi:hypothetical protein
MAWPITPAGRDGEIHPSGRAQRLVMINDPVTDDVDELHSFVAAAHAWFMEVGIA